ncbi:MAG: M20 family metallopeptidase [Pseudomonadota bacterium]
MAIAPADILADLVAFDTQNPPGREVEAAGHVHALLSDIGFETVTDVYAPGRANVIARLDNGPGPHFVFNTHLDVVPAGEGWTSDPFCAAVKGGRLIARGACDAKGSLAAMLTACGKLAGQREAWSGTLSAVFVADEEAASGGAKHLVETGARYDYAVIGEPTGNGVVCAHKGSLRPVVDVRGRTAHSGTPQEGVNAVFHAARLLHRFEHLAQKVGQNSHPLCGSASLTVTRMTGGHADNVVPETASFLLDRRMVPGEDAAAAAVALQAVLDEARVEDGIDASIARWQPTTGGPVESDPSHSFVRAALAACARHGGDGTAARGFQGACDMVHFARAGATCVVIGPGSLSEAHKPDESVSLDELAAAAEIYADLALATLRR